MKNATQCPIVLPEHVAVCAHRHGVVLLGTAARRLALIVEHDDTNIEDELNRRAAAGQKTPVIVAPYAEVDGEGQVIKRSTKYLEVDDLSAELRTRVLDADQRVEKLRSNQYTMKQRS